MIKQSITCNYLKVKCCICLTEVDENKTLTPSRCLTKNGSIKSHKICQECWWNSVTGFAIEGTNHSCPGCLKIDNL
jgi:hypothetical protein